VKIAVSTSVLVLFCETRERRWRVEIRNIFARKLSSNVFHLLELQVRAYKNTLDRKPAIEVIKAVIRGLFFTPLVV